MLMDEPFSALDAQTRLSMQELLLDVFRQVRTTVLFVTHDIDEAIFLSDRIALMTRRPCRVGAELAVPFGRPRTAAIVGSGEFAAIKRRCPRPSATRRRGRRASPPIWRPRPAREARAAPARAAVVTRGSGSGGSGPL